MKKIVKQLGGSIGILFSPEEQITNDINLGDVIDVRIASIIKKGKKK